MTYYVVCPDCGYKLLKAGDGSTIEIYCPKCKAKLQISINDGKVLIQKQAVDTALFNTLFISITTPPSNV